MNNDIANKLLDKLLSSEEGQKGLSRGIEEHILARFAPLSPTPVRLAIAYENELAALMKRVRFTPFNQGQQMMLEPKITYDRINDIRPDSSNWR